MEPDKLTSHLLLPNKTYFHLNFCKRLALNILNSLFLLHLTMYHYEDVFRIIPNLSTCFPLMENALK